MKKIVAIVSLTALVASFAVAGPQKKGAKMPTCPACKMELTSKKDKMHTMAVKMNGKTYYCCSACKMKKPAKK